jgi:RecJ-like exonuclease
MIAKFRCDKCEGSGKETKTVRHSDNANTVGDSHHGVSYYTNSCPSCHEGWVALAVPCEKCEGQGATWGYVKGQYVSQDMAMDAGMPEIAGSYLGDEPEPMPCEICETKGYRLLTEAEVEEYGIGRDELMESLRTGIPTVTFRGKPVSVVPCEEG